MPGGEIEEGCAYYGVVADFELMAVFEDEDGWLANGFGGRWVGLNILWRSRLSGSMRGRRSFWRNVGIGAGSAAVENCGASLIVGIAIVGSGVTFSLIFFGGCKIDGVRNRESVEHGAIAGVMVVMAVSMAWVRYWGRG